MGRKKPYGKQRMLLHILNKELLQMVFSFFIDLQRNWFLSICLTDEDEKGIR
jgi:hypothetical protein